MLFCLRRHRRVLQHMTFGPSESRLALRFWSLQLNELCSESGNIGLRVNLERDDRMKAVAGLGSEDVPVGATAACICYTSSPGT